MTGDTSAPPRPHRGSTAGFAGADAVARVRALLRGELAPVPARPAATVVLVRDSAGGPEVYLLRRVPTMAFAPGALMHPTVAALEAVAAHATVADVLAARPRVAPVLPRLVPDGDGALVLLVPGDPAYEVAAPGAWGSAPWPP